MNEVEAVTWDKINHPIIAVDLDGPIATERKDLDFGKCDVVDGAHEGLNKLKELGYKIFIYTARPWPDFEVTVAWLKAKKIPYDQLIMGKLLARFYIDDRAVHFRSWNEVDYERFKK